MRVAVVGHVEWIQFARVCHVPATGELVEAAEWWEEPAGGAAIAAVQALRLGAEVEFFAAAGDDALGHAAIERFRELGLTVHPVFRGRQRRGLVQLDRDGERTILILGERTVPHGADPLPWDRLAGADAVYLTGGDAAALRAARAARALVATPRAGDALRAGVKLDALVRSAADAGESGDALDPAPRWVISTRGHDGGRWVGEDHRTGRWRAAEVPGPRGDSYGAGDSFAGALAFGLGSGMGIEEALALAARAGAHKLTGRGAFEGQLRELPDHRVGEQPAAQGQDGPSAA
jgi:ribokinase